LFALCGILMIRQGTLRRRPAGLQEPGVVDEKTLDVEELGPGVDRKSEQLDLAMHRESEWFGCNYFLTAS